MIIDDDNPEVAEPETPPTGERAWVETTLVPRLAEALAKFGTEQYRVMVGANRGLAYTSEIFKYPSNPIDDLASESRRYKTDLLVYDEFKDGSGWVPRVVIECKLGDVTTHDALTYSTKAATHKHVHPYLRYGLLIGRLKGILPAKLLWHGAYFDFMTAWKAEQPCDKEWSSLVSVLADELESSRLLQEVTTNGKGNRQKYRLFHRRLDRQEALK